MNRKYKKKYRGVNKTNKVIASLAIVFCFMAIGYSIYDQSIKITGRSIIPSDNVRKIISNGLKNGDLKFDDVNTYMNSTLDYSSKYYFEGADPKNYVIYNNACFRIISVSQNNTVKIIYDGKATDDSKCVGVSTSTSGNLRNKKIYNNSNNNFYDSAIRRIFQWQYR